MDSIPFSTPYPRPTKLSDLSNHFDPKILKKLLQTPDDRLGFSEFRTLFHFDTPPGDYQDIVYFLPWALEKMRQCPDDAIQFMTGVIHFISENSERLRQNHILETTRTEVAACFKTWTSHFKVEHFDRTTCREKGWGLEYFDLVDKSQAVEELIDDLWTYKSHGDLADQWVKSVSALGQEEMKSAWFLEYSRAARQNVVASIKSSLVIPKLTRDQALLRKHYDSIEKTLIASEPSPTYWKTVRAELEQEILNL